MNKIEFTDKYFMKQAFTEAYKARDKDEVPVGAVIVCNNQIIARAHNLSETLKDVTAHAEMLAITAASEYLGGKYLNDCTLYVTLEPCTMCAGALNWSQIGRIVYASKDEKRGYSLYSPSILHPKTKTDYGIMADESKDLLIDFFKSKR
ncbi:MAG: nucleoside deaminase [Chlorobi bacterium]|nr:nucleoside deaminase [Chlorobiota bacterium]